MVWGGWEGHEPAKGVAEELAVVGEGMVVEEEKVECEEILLISYKIPLINILVSVNIFYFT